MPYQAVWIWFQRIRGEVAGDTCNAMCEEKCALARHTQRIGYVCVLLVVK